MPIPMAIARFNRRVTNRLTRPIAGWAPGLGIIEHAGRRSGRRYRTPVDVFRRGETVTVALTYGPESEWVKNVLAAGACSVHTSGRTLHLTEPRLVHDEQRRAVPAFVRPVLRLISVSYFLLMTVIAEQEKAG